VSDQIRRCARGCTRWGKHLPSCADRDSCRGCLPRDAEHGLLCYGCHKRLVEHLRHAPGQVHLLDVMTAMRGEVEMTALPKQNVPTSWRIDSAQRLSYLYAKGGHASHGASEPVRLACIDSIREIEDRLHLWAVAIEADYQLCGVEDQGLHSYAEWLLRHVERIEWRESIGDELEDFVEVMSQAHTLAPWREQVARLRGIPCPECHTTTLAIFGGDEDVTCVRCRATMSKERYGIWTRILAQAHKEATG